MPVDLVGEFPPQAENQFHVGMFVRSRMYGFCRTPPRNAGNPPQTKLVGSDPSVDVLVAIFAHNAYSIHDSPLCRDEIRTVNYFSLQKLYNVPYEKLRLRRSAADGDAA